MDNLYDMKVCNITLKIDGGKNFSCAPSEGPFDISVLAQMATAGQLTTDSLVWKSGMAQWAKAGTVDELKNLFTNTMSPISPQE